MLPYMAYMDPMGTVFETVRKISKRDSRDSMHIPSRAIDLVLVIKKPAKAGSALRQENSGIRNTIEDGSKPWYLVNPKIAGKWMFIPLKCIYI